MKPQLILEKIIYKILLTFNAILLYVYCVVHNPYSYNLNKQPVCNAKKTQPPEVRFTSGFFYF